MNDLELLHQYADTGSQPAFATVVGRYVDLVYSAAKRQVRSPDLAKEVAQSVFLDLARAARTLRADTHLASWLHVAARRRAIDIVRREASRQRWEQSAAKEEVMTTTSTPWTEIEPLLDEALDSLNDVDRKALLLRFFENHSLAEISAALGCTEDAAQKRVGRALERLRAFFTRRGVITVAAALAMEISAHGVEIAPSGTAASILAGLASRVTVIAAQHATRAATVSLLKAVALALAMIGATGFAAYEGYRVHQRRAEIAALASVTERWRDELQASNKTRDQARSVMKGVSVQADALLSNDAAFDLRIRAALAHLAEVKRRFAADPRQVIPEMSYLSFSDWFGVVQEQPRWDSADDWSNVLASVRIRAINRSGNAFERALQKFVRKSGGQLPTQIGDLAPFFDLPIDRAMLARYELRASGMVAALAEHAVVIAQKPSTAVDPERDNVSVIGVGWSGVTGAFAEDSVNVKLQQAVEEPLRAYRAAHDGKEPDPQHPELLQPYFTDPEKGAAYVEIMKQIVAQMPQFKEPNAAGLATNAYRAAHNGVGPKTAADLLPYFRYPEDGAVYLRLEAANEPR
jgi:RNA polymerase sigma factor (sigma-70 family)